MIVRDLKSLDMPFVIDGTRYEDPREIPVDILASTINRLNVGQDSDGIYIMYIETTRRND